MKKIIAVFALAALVCGAAFADVTMTNWEPLDYNGNLSVTDYGSAGFDVELPDGVNSEGFDVDTYDVSGWLFDPNETITVTLSGFDNDAFIASDNSWLTIDIGNYEDDYFGEYKLPWTGNGTYTFTADDIQYADEVLEGTEITYVNIYGWDYNDADGCVYINPGASGRVTVVFGVPEEEEGTVVPEPGVCAYALMGLGSLVGMKKRFVK